MEHGWRHISGTLKDLKWLKDGMLNTLRDVVTNQIDQHIS